MSTDSQSPFDQDGTQTGDTDNQVNEHPLIGPGKKYATAEAALASIIDSQEHISNLEAENAALRQEEDRLKTVEQTLDDMKTKQEPDPLNEEALATLVDSRIASNTKEQTMQANVDEVVTTLSKHFGGNDKAKSAYEQKAVELGMSVEAMTTLSATSPKAVLDFFDVKQSTQAPTKTMGTVNTETLTNASSGEHTYAWWQNLRKADEKQYYKRAPEMHSDVARLGREKFYGT